MACAWGGVVVLGCLLLAACGDDDGGSSTAPDAGRPADAAPPDAAPPDAALRDGLWYLMDSIAVPETSDEAVTVALDLDGDGQPDNALGGLLAALHSSADLPIAAVQMEAVTAGHILQLVGIDAGSLDDADPVPVLVARGVDLDGDAGDNASGAEPFALDPLDGADGQLTGLLVGGRLRAGPGTAPIQLAMFGVTPEVVALRGVGARLRAASVTDGAMAGGRTCGALTEEDADSILIPAMARAVDSIVQRDCDGATCDPDTQGEQLAAFFDDNSDGMVPEEEFAGNSLIESTIGNPDLDLYDADGNFDPRVDGVKDSLSLCLGFTAVGARAYQ
jgi:hypothetical protein